MESAVKRGSDMLITDLSPFVDQTSNWDLSTVCSHGHQSHLAGEDSGPWSQTVKSLMDVTFTKSHNECEAKQTRAQAQHSEGMLINAAWFDFVRRNEYISREAIKIWLRPKCQTLTLG